MMHETQSIPPGFERHYRQSPVTDPWEPIYSRKTDEAVILGLVAEAVHTNSRGFVHGGLISALADNAMGLSCSHRLGGEASLVTVNLTLDFLGSAQVEVRWRGLTMVVSGDYKRRRDPTCAPFEPV